MESQRLLKASVKAFNEIPNKKLSGNDYKDTYAIASAIDNHLKSQDAASYILAYTLRQVKYAKNGISPQDHFTDHFEVFCEYDENENSPRQQAEIKLDEIRASYEDEDSETELYSWNICRIVKTSEHYTV